MALRAQVTFRGWVLLELAVGLRENVPDATPADAIAKPPLGFTAAREVGRREPAADA